MENEKTRILTHPLNAREVGLLHPWISFGIAGLSLLSMVAFAVAPHTTELQVPRYEVVEELELSLAPESVARDMTFVRQEFVRRGETLASLLQRMGVEDARALDFLRQSPAAESLRHELRVGKSLTLSTDERGRLMSLTLPLAGEEDQALRVERLDGEFAAHTVALESETRVLMRSAEIKSSLFAAADQAELPDSVALQLAEIFGAEIDFHRDLRRGDRFSVAYEAVYHQGRLVRSGRVLAARFVNNGTDYSASYFANHNGKAEYFDRSGKSLRKAFLRSPLEFSRISSGFTESRFHPILRRWRAHKGVNYAAPIGTRVKATADGVVEFVGRQSGYGNLIVLRHHDNYTTHYGHLNGFAAGVREGSRVEQGDVIGYVGQTGWATGPHLHYEFRAGDVHHDPLGAALPVAIPLDSRQFADFKSKVNSLFDRLALIRPSDAVLN